MEKGRGGGSQGMYLNQGSKDLVITAIVHYDYIDLLRQVSKRLLTCFTGSYSLLIQVHLVYQLLNLLNMVALE